MTSSFGKVTDQTGALGTNDWGKTISGGAWQADTLTVSPGPRR